MWGGNKWLKRKRWTIVNETKEEEEAGLWGGNKDWGELGWRNGAVGRTYSLRRKGEW